MYVFVKQCSVGFWYPDLVGTCQLTLMTGSEGKDGSFKVTSFYTFIRKGKHKVKLGKRICPADVIGV